MLQEDTSMPSAGREGMNLRTETKIHPTAIVERGAELGKGVEIGPFCVISAKARIHDRVHLHSHVVVQGRVEIGEETEIWSFASIATAPQDLKYRGEDTELWIGKRNKIREYCNLSIGTALDAGMTRIGDNNLLMVNTHVAHDCLLGSNIIIANGVSLAGHVQVANGAVLGGHCAVHQFARIGELALLAGGSMVSQDVPPFVTVFGNHASPTGLNSLGLKRAGFSSETLLLIKRMYKLFFQSNLASEAACVAIRENIPDCPQRQTFLEFVENSKRGICR